jgi:hypothetical protein
VSQGQRSPGVQGHCTRRYPLRSAEILLVSEAATEGEAEPRPTSAASSGPTLAAEPADPGHRVTTQVVIRCGLVPTEPSLPG